MEFRDLAVVVVDEQHRFGVRQRAAMDAKAPDGLTPHALHMTATPIPRTLSLTAYGDLDASVLRELPAGRRPVETLRGGRRPSAAARVRADPRGDRRRPPVLRRLPAGRGVRGAAGHGGHRRVRAAALHGVPRPASRADSRPAPVEGKAGCDGGVRRGQGRRARGHQRDRGRDRRAERDGDADRGRGALRALAAAPAPRPGRAAADTGRSASCSATPSCRVSTRSPARTTASASRRWTSSSAAPVTCSALASTGCPSCGWRGCPRTPSCSCARATAPTSSCVRDPDLSAPEHALLRDAVAARFGSELDPIPA